MKRKNQNNNQISIGDLVTFKNKTANSKTKVGVVVNIYVTTFSRSPTADVLWTSGEWAGGEKSHNIDKLEKINA